MTDPYLFAHEANRIGITTCMPLLSNLTLKEDKNPSFYGAQCLDILVSDKISKYFPSNQAEGDSLIFKVDDNYDKATYKSYFLGNDMIYDTIRNHFIKYSSFYNDTKSFFQSKYSQKDIKIDKLKIEADKALLFDRDWNVWGELKLSIDNKD